MVRNASGHRKDARLPKAEKALSESYDPELMDDKCSDFSVPQSDQAVLPDNSVDADETVVPPSVDGGSSQISGRPARMQLSSFGDDEQLASEFPAGWTLRRFQDVLKGALNEFILTRLMNETVRRIRDLVADCPCEADEVGVVAMRLALDSNDATQKDVVGLLQGLRSAGVLDGAALVRSFEKLFCAWEDIAIDTPQAPEILLRMLHGCVESGVVGQALLMKLPENLLNAGLTKASPEVSRMLTGVASQLKKFKRAVNSSLEEYFVALNVAEVETFLRELEMDAFHHEFVKRVIVLSFSQNNVEAGRDAALTLLSQLTSAGVLTKDDLQWGLTRLLGQLEDLALDCPQSNELATVFCCALVEEELVSVPFLRRCRQLRIGGVTGVRVLDATQRRTPEFSKKHLGSAEFKNELQTMILEYFNSGDKVEFGRCVSEMAPLAPGQSAELVRKVMTLAMERSSAERALGQTLLSWLCRHEELAPAAVEIGFNELYVRMPDLTLDVPNAREMAQAFVVEAKGSGVLRQDWNEPSG
mmetsp:Transcript_62091/g.134771  ORF Transcript_62091/g.134771 Transcript_62091/m.134771 type:complete len:530 (+) Transcript_62091:97-1686(+)